MDRAAIKHSFHDIPRFEDDPSAVWKRLAVLQQLLTDCITRTARPARQSCRRIPSALHSAPSLGAILGDRSAPASQSHALQDSQWHWAKPTRAVTPDEQCQVPHPAVRAGEGVTLQKFRGWEVPPPHLSLALHQTYLHSHLTQHTSQHAAKPASPSPDAQQNCEL